MVGVGERDPVQVVSRFGNPENDREPLHLGFQTPRQRNGFNHFQPAEL